jgi:hypothetical protein
MLGGINFATGANNFFPEGGFDSIFLRSSGREDIWFAQYDVGHTGTSGVGVTHTQAITDVVNGFESYVNNYFFATLGVSGVSGGIPFTLGNPGDVIHLSGFSWGTGTLFNGGTDSGLVSNTGASLGGFTGDASMFNVGSAGQSITAGIVVLDSIATYANFTDYVNALKTATVGNLFFSVDSLPINGLEHHLIAVNIGNDVHITDVVLRNDSGAIIAGVDTANPGINVQVHDLIDLVGVGQVGNMLPHNINFV